MIERSVQGSEDVAAHCTVLVPVMVLVMGLVLVLVQVEMSSSVRFSPVEKGGFMESITPKKLDLNFNFSRWFLPVLLPSR